jgi:ATP-binding cassette subfamily F protein uup
MDRLVDHLFVFEGEGVIRDFPGNYSDYRMSGDKYADRSTEMDDSKERIVEKNIKKIDGITKLVGTSVLEKKRMNFNEKREFELLQKEIEALNKEKELLTNLLASGETNFTKLQQASERIGQITDDIDEKEFRWLELSELAP